MKKNKGSVLSLKSSTVDSFTIQLCAVDRIKMSQTAVEKKNLRFL